MPVQAEDTGFALLLCMYVCEYTHSVVCTYSDSDRASTVASIVICLLHQCII